MFNFLFNFSGLNNSNNKNTQSKLKNYIPKDQLMKKIEQQKINSKNSTKGGEENQVKSDNDINSNMKLRNANKEIGENKLESESPTEKEINMEIIQEES